MNGHELLRQGLSLTLLCNGSSESGAGWSGRSVGLVVDPENHLHFAMTPGGSFPSVHAVRAELCTLTSSVLLAGLFSCAGWTGGLIKLEVKEKILRAWGSDCVESWWVWLASRVLDSAFHTVVTLKLCWEMLGILKKGRLLWTNRNVNGFCRFVEFLKLCH